MGWGKSPFFHNLILFYRVLSKLQEAFNGFKKIKIICEIYQVKVGDYNRFLIGGVNLKLQIS